MKIQISYMDTSATGSNYVVGSRTSQSSQINLALSGSASDSSIYFIYGATSNRYNPGITRVKNVKYHAVFETVSDVSGYRVHGHLDNLNTGLSYDGYSPIFLHHWLLMRLQYMYSHLIQAIFIEECVCIHYLFGNQVFLLLTIFLATV